MNQDIEESTPYYNESQDCTLWKLPTGELHREHGPAFESRHGIQMWYIRGRRHRDGAPAAIYSDGSVIWYKHGEIHREDGPAFESAAGGTRFYLWDKHYATTWEWARAVLRMHGNENPCEEEINDKLQNALTACILS